jgi:hypothetical protein
VQGEPHRIDKLIACSKGLSMIMGTLVRSVLNFTPFL